MDSASPTADRIVGSEQTSHSPRDWTLAGEFFAKRSIVRTVMTAAQLSTAEADDTATTATAGVI